MVGTLAESLVDHRFKVITNLVFVVYLKCAGQGRLHSFLSCANFEIFFDKTHDIFGLDGLGLPEDIR